MATLPPTKGASNQHSLRVYLQLKLLSHSHLQESQDPIYTPAMFYRDEDILTPQQHNQTLQYLSQPRIRIVEQPASKQLRFRYESETRSVGCIRGAKSTPENKTFPTISVEGYQGRAMVRVSCVTKDMPYRPHPFKLVMKGTEDDGTGIISLNDVSINGPDSLITFQNVGIKCVRRGNMAESLNHREFLGVDPFSTGFSHKNRPSSIDLNVVRLCFEVFLGDTSGKFVVKVAPIVSNPILNMKERFGLSILQLSDCTSSAKGGKKIILLCEKVMKGDIQVRFFEENSGWEAFVDIQPVQIHKQVAIWFITPQYKAADVTNVVKVFIQLVRPSDGARGDPLPFQFLPDLKRKYESPDEFMSRFKRFVADNNFNISGEGVKMDAAVASCSNFNISGGAVKVDATGRNNLNISGGATRVDPAASFTQTAGIGAYEPVPDMYCPNILNPELEMPASLANDNLSNNVKSDELEEMVSNVDQESPLVELDNSLFLMNIDSITDMNNFESNDFIDL